MIYIYILKCADASYYTGITKDLSTRLTEHSKKRASYTKNKLPFVVWHVEYRDDRKAAAAQERKIKNTGAKKYLIRFQRDTTFPVVPLNNNLLIKFSFASHLLVNFVAAR